MPVLDHEVHPSTKKGSEFRYGCWNKPAVLNHRMSDRCRFDMSATDPFCVDCVHRGKGGAYAKSVINGGV